MEKRVWQGVLHIDRRKKRNIEVSKMIGKSGGISVLFRGWLELGEIGKQPKLHKPEGTTWVTGEIGGCIIMNASNNETPNDGGQRDGFPFCKSQGQIGVLFCDGSRGIEKDELI